MSASPVIRKSNNDYIFMVADSFSKTTIMNPYKNIDAMRATFFFSFWSTFACLTILSVIEIQYFSIDSRMHHGIFLKLISGYVLTKVINRIVVHVLMKHRKWAF